MATTNRQEPIEDYVPPAGHMPGIGSSDGPLSVGRAFLSALERRDFEALEACFEPEATFRALVPSGVREGSGRQQAVAWLRHWFGPADRFEVQRMGVDSVADCLHISYRIRLREEGVWYLIEQQAYCVAGDGQVQAMNLVCSGFRPV